MATKQDPTTSSTRFSTWRMVLGIAVAVAALGTGLLSLKVVSIHGVPLTASSFMTPLVFTLLCVIGEVYGYGTAQRIALLTTVSGLALSIGLFLVSFAPDGLDWQGAQTIHDLQAYAPTFVFDTTMVFAMVELPLLYVQDRWRARFPSIWTRIGPLPLVGQIIAGVGIVTACYGAYVSPRQLVILLLSRIAFGGLFAGAMLTPTFMLIRVIRRFENREAIAYALKNADVVTMEAELRSRMLANQLTDALISIDDRSRIVYANPACAAMFGHSVMKLMSDDLSLIQPERFRRDHTKGLQKHLATHQRSLNWDRVETYGLRADGAEFPIVVSLLDFRRDGQRFFTGIIRRREDDHDSSSASAARTTGEL